MNSVGNGGEDMSYNGAQFVNILIETNAVFTECMCCNILSIQM